jgi:hypothetical protein
MLYRLADSVWKHYLNWRAVNYEFWRLRWFNADWFYLNIDSLMVLSIVALFLSFTIIFLARRFSEEKVNIMPHYLLYLMVYWMIFGFWWLASGAYTVAGKRVSWGQKSFDKR